VKYERRKDKIERLVAEQRAQIAYIAENHTGPPGKTVARQSYHSRAAVNGDHTRSIGQKPIGIPAVAASGIKNILPTNIGQEGQRRRSLVESIPRPLINL
jgi:hypothetical protein